MGVLANVRALEGALPRIAFRWDRDTDILSGTVYGADATGGLTGTVDLQGSPGGFVVIDVERGAIRSIDVVDWPEDVRTRPALGAPQAAPDAALVFPARASQPGVAAVELEAGLTVEKTEDESVFHFAVAGARPATVVRVADHLLVELDNKSELVGLWLLAVPPFPDVYA